MSKKKAEYVLALIEDHPDIIRMYSVMFETMLNVEVQVAEDVKSGEAVIRKKNPDLVLLDLIIPTNKGDSFEPTSRHGFDLLEKIRKEEEFRDLPVMVLTNLESMKDRAKAKELGAVEYIIKSQTLPNQLAKQVNDFFENKKK